MTNSLLKNETEFFYTVQASENTVVSRSEFYGAKLREVQVSRNFNEAFRYPNKDVANEVAVYVDGAVIKHTRTTVVTEVTEEIKIEGEN